MNNHPTASRVRTQRPIPVWRKLAYGSLALVAILGSLELACRIVGLGAKPEVADYVADWQVQWQDDFYVLSATPGSAVNRDGLRDYDHFIANSRDRRRIVCLGDSVTFGFDLPFEDSYPAILEAQLTDLGHEIEVFNVALPGWSTRQQRIAYRRIARKYRPDHVILGFCLNDVAEMQNNLRQPAQLAVQLYQHSHFFRGLLPAESRAISRVEELFRAPEADHIRRGWALCFEEIRRLAEDVERDGGEFSLLVFPFRFQLQASAPAPRPQRALQEFAARHQLNFVDVLPALKQLGPQAFVDHDHLSRQGAEMVAAEIGRQFDRDLSPDDLQVCGEQGVRLER